MAVRSWRERWSRVIALTGVIHLPEPRILLRVVFYFHYRPQTKKGCPFLGSASFKKMFATLIFVVGIRIGFRPTIS